MSADSPSSMDAQNGSAYSNGGSYPPYQQRRPPTSYPANTSEYRNDGSSAVDYHRSHRDGRESQNPSSYQATPTHGQRASQQAYANQADYFLPDHAYAQQPARYDNNLAFDDDQNGSPANSGYTGQTTHQNGVYHSQQTPAQGYYNTHENGQRNAQHSPTTQRWSTEISPEERIRLGLPRYESEEQRLAYENTGVQYDQNNNQTQQ